MSRIISLKVIGDIDWSKEVDLDFGSICVLVYYCSTINRPMSLKLMNALLTESTYRYENDIPSEAYTSDNPISHYGPENMQELIYFLTNQIIPNLSTQEIDLISQVYGGIENFINLYYDGPPFLGYFGIGNSELFEGFSGYTPNLVICATSLCAFFQRVKERNMKYEIYIE
ncbi:hypothetical protein [Chryseobacterium sp. CT-SW4]|uniref:hypothetical protein n=1 Tax=Chryseobacterium sp. SW-1 TaxID=3157343 RepID=UPI003B029EC6